MDLQVLVGCRAEERQLPAPGSIGKGPRDHRIPKRVFRIHVNGLKGTSEFRRKRYGSLQFRKEADKGRRIAPGGTAGIVRLARLGGHNGKGVQQGQPAAEGGGIGLLLMPGRLMQIPLPVKAFGLNGIGRFRKKAPQDGPFRGIRAQIKGPAEFHTGI